MKAILTTVGEDQVGIIAGVSQYLAENKVNILDLSQTIMDGYFTMMMMVDVPETKKNSAFWHKNCQTLVKSSALRFAFATKKSTVRCIIFNGGKYGKRKDFRNDSHDF